ncbi:MAG: PHP domain-containing protein [Methanomicrobiaceae archaeon]|nr:PHP domain-containing protein [Methanomicrobiaceae archaeon]
MPLSYVNYNPLIEDSAGERCGSGSGTVMFDMHVHSVYSNDSINEVRTIVRAWEKTGILPLVCDHDSIKGSQKVYEAIREIEPDIPEIWAEEILTADGEIIGAFLNEEISPGLGADETLDIIQEQGALSIVPHPFCTYRTTAIDRRVLERIGDRIDIIEGYNARTPDARENSMGRTFAKKNGKPISAGSDAHTPVELARNYIIIKEFGNPSELIRNIRDGEILFTPAPAEVHEFTILFKKMRRENNIQGSFNKNIDILIQVAGIANP